MLCTAAFSSLNRSCLLSPENTSISPCSFSIGTKSSYLLAVFWVCDIISFSSLFEVTTLAAAGIEAFFALSEGLYSSAAKWKFVPPKPNDDTFALLILSLFHSRASVITLNGVDAQSTIGLGVTKLIEGGSTLLCKASITFITDAMPAAAFAWPICDFTEPNPIEPAGAYGLKISSKAESSAASPTFVAVPCASIRPISPGV